MSEDDELAEERDRLMNERARLVLNGVDPAELAMPAPAPMEPTEYVAIQEIPWGPTRAYHVGEAVPSCIVERLGWLRLGFVAERAQPCVYVLKPGDRLLIQPRHPISMETAKRMSARLHRCLGDDFRFAIISHDIDIKVLRPEPPESWGGTASER